MSYRITGLPAARFAPFFKMSDQELRDRHIVRMTVNEKPGFPCRITLEDAEPGETVLLLNYEHQPAASPYRSCHAIFVRESAARQYEGINAIPGALRNRLLSVRAFDEHGMMKDADIVEGSELEALIEHLFKNTEIAYLQVHNAKRGCYAARVDRA